MPLLRKRRSPEAGGESADGRTNGRTSYWDFENIAAKDGDAEGEDRYTENWVFFNREADGESQESEAPARAAGPHPFGRGCAEACQRLNEWAEAALQVEGSSPRTLRPAARIVSATRCVMVADALPRMKEAKSLLADAVREGMRGKGATESQSLIIPVRLLRNIFDPAWADEPGEQLDPSDAECALAEDIQMEFISIHSGGGVTTKVEVRECPPDHVCYTHDVHAEASSGASSGGGPASGAQPAGRKPQFGVYAREVVPLGTPIGEYVGVVECVKSDDAGASQDQTVLASQPDEADDSQESDTSEPHTQARQSEYVFGLPLCKGFVGDIDADKRRNATAFINDPHGTSAEANCIFLSVFSLDAVPHAVVVTTREIPEGGELLIDYGREFWDNIGTDTVGRMTGAQEAPIVIEDDELMEGASAPRPIRAGAGRSGRKARRGEFFVIEDKLDEMDEAHVGRGAGVSAKMRASNWSNSASARKAPRGEEEGDSANAGASGGAARKASWVGDEDACMGYAGAGRARAGTAGTPGTDRAGDGGRRPFQREPSANSASGGAARNASREDAGESVRASARKAHMGDDEDEEELEFAPEGVESSARKARRAARKPDRNTGHRTSQDTRVQRRDGESPGSRDRGSPGKADAPHRDRVGDGGSAGKAPKGDHEETDLTYEVRGAGALGRTPLPQRGAPRATTAPQRAAGAGVSGSKAAHWSNSASARRAPRGEEEDEEVDALVRTPPPQRGSGVSGSAARNAPREEDADAPIGHAGAGGAVPTVPTTLPPCSVQAGKAGTPGTDRAGDGGRRPFQREPHKSSSRGGSLPPSLPRGGAGGGGGGGGGGIALARGKRGR